MVLLQSTEKLNPNLLTSNAYRQSEQKKQARLFKITLPIALVLHGLTIGGFAMLAQRVAPEMAATEEVEIVADNIPKEQDD